MTLPILIALAVAAGLLLLVGGVALLGRRAFVAVSEGQSPFAGWSWRPNQFGLVLLIGLPIAALVLWRVFPVFLFLPIILPFVFRGMGRGFTWRRGDRQRPSSNGHKKDDDSTIEGSYRSLDDE
jgi:hypothetical protein